MLKPDYMAIAFSEAEAAATRGEVPVGAVLVDSDTGAILAQDGNRTEELRDPTAHAEILVIRAAAKLKNQPRLPKADLYVTLEPCALCAAAISFARLRNIYYAAFDPKGGAIEHGPRFFSQATCHYAPKIRGGLDHEKSTSLLRQFFAQKRI